MGTKRVGLARVEALIENLKRELALGSGSSIVADSLSLSSAGTSVVTEKAVTTTVTITAPTADDSDGSFVQPAGTHIKELILVPQAAITTGNTGGTDELDFSLGTAAGGGQLLAAKALLDGQAVTAAANTPLYLISDGQSTMGSTNAFAAVPGGPATSEASPLAATTFSAAARTLHVRFKAVVTNLTAVGDVKIIAVFSSQ